MEECSSSSSISVEAFLWHPHSIKYDIDESKYTYNDQLLSCLDDDDDDDGNDDHGNNGTATSSRSCLRIELPPRMVVQQKWHQHKYDLQVKMLFAICFPFFHFLI